MEDIKLWQLIPSVQFYIHHSNLEDFVIPKSKFEQWTVMIVESGSFAYEWEEEYGTVTKPCIICFPPNVNLSRNILEPMTFHYLRIDFKYPDGTYANKNAEIPVGEIHISNLQRLQSDLFYLKFIATKADDFSIHLLNHTFTDIWNLYCCDLFTTGYQFEIDSSDTIMKKAIRFINENAFDSINLSDIAKNIGLSPVQFTRRFHSAFNSTPIEYLTQLRINKVQSLLMESNMTLRQIAHECGYKDEYYLSRVFTKRKKISPSKYRKISRE